MQWAAPVLLPRSRELRVRGGKTSTIRVPTRHGDVTCTVYRPAVVAPGEPTYVNFHGGAFIARHPAQDDHACRIIAAGTGATVVNVDYDTAPQVRYPVAEEQAYDVVTELQRQFGDAVAVGGFSAGGKLAVNVCQQAHRNGTALPVSLTAVYPVVDMTLTPSERTSQKAVPVVPPWLLRLMYRSYFADAVRRAEPLASPGTDAHLGYLPPTLILTAQLDTVAAEGDRFAERLAAAGVKVTHHSFPGVDHFFTHDTPEAARVALRMIVDHVSTGFTSDLR